MVYNTNTTINSDSSQNDINALFQQITGVIINPEPEPEPDTDTDTDTDTDELPPDHMTEEEMWQSLNNPLKPSSEG